MEKDRLKAEVHQKSEEVLGLKDEIQILELQLASQSSAQERIKSQAQEALQRETLYRSRLEFELKKAKEVSTVSDCKKNEELLLRKSYITKKALF